LRPVPAVTEPNTQSSRARLNTNMAHERTVQHRSETRIEGDAMPHRIACPERKRVIFATKGDRPHKNSKNVPHTPRATKPRW
ncbi:unnamed protein product, partial [Ixodes persulcatus]